METEAQTLNERLLDAMAEVTEALHSAPGVFQYWAEPEEIETEARSGYIPFTDGGAHVCVGAVLSYCLSSGSFPTEVVREYAERIQGYAQKEWERQTGKSLDSVMNARDSDDKATRDQAESDWDEFGEFEHEYLMEGCEFYYKARAILYRAGNWRSPDKSQDVVLFDVYLCMDSYGRDSIPWLKAYGSNTDQTEGDYRRVVPVSELSDDRLREIVEEMSAQF